MVSAAEYVPDRGDVIWVTFNPQTGRGQAGRRLGGAIPHGLSVTGVVLADQIKSLDWRAGEAELIGTLPERTVIEVLRKLGTLLSP